MARLLDCARGSVTIEYLVLYPVLFTIFLTAAQLALVEVGSLTTSHAAVEAARSASVILADDPRYYGGTPVGVPAGRRLEDITDSARLPLTVVARQPQVRVTFPGRTAFRQGDQVKVRVELDFPCQIAVGTWLVCGTKPSIRLSREATMPYQGAGYTYP